jgi:hypothetical protein
MDLVLYRAIAIRRIPEDIDTRVHRAPLIPLAIQNMITTAPTDDLDA